MGDPHGLSSLMPRLVLRCDNELTYMPACLLWSTDGQENDGAAYYTTTTVCEAVRPGSTSACDSATAAVFCDSGQWWTSRGVSTRTVCVIHWTHRSVVHHILVLRTSVWIDRFHIGWYLMSRVNFIVCLYLPVKLTRTRLDGAQSVFIAFSRIFSITSSRLQMQWFVRWTLLAALRG